MIAYPPFFVHCALPPLTDNHPAQKPFFETPHNEIKCVLSIEESNFNDKFSLLLSVRAEGTGPLLPPYVQPDRKISGSLRLPFANQ